MTDVTNSSKLPVNMNILGRPALQNGYFEACDREPIHIPGSIQPHGVLLAFDLSDGRLAFASENVWEYLGLPNQELSKLHFEDFAGKSENGESLFHTAQEIAKLNPYQRIPMKFPGVLRFLKVELHLSRDNYLVLEIERVPKVVETPALLDVAVEEKLRVKQLLHSLEGDLPFQELMGRVAHRVRQLTQYDRVMIYKFDEFGNGEVLVDDHRNDLESFQGLNYPASDIPRQARELYLANRVRQLVDARAAAVKLTACGVHDGPNPILDMSLCGLRSFSPIHLQYLENMGVRSTLAISVILDGKLWGLIVAHHMTPKMISSELRMQCDLYSHILSAAIQSEERRRHENAILESQNCYLKIEVAAKKSQDWKNYLFEESQVLIELLGACGVLWVASGERRSLGRLPEESILQATEARVSELQIHEVLTAEEWKSVIPNMPTTDSPIAGFAALMVSKSPVSYLIWFRENRSKSVLWGGNPNKPVNTNDTSGVLTPRKSFEKWQQDVSGICAAWTEQDRLRAKAIGLFFSVKQTEDANRIKSRFLTNMSHEIRTPMTAILGYTDVLIEQLPDQEVECRKAAETIRRSGKHLLTMLNDLLDIAKIESGKMEFTSDSIVIRELFQDIVAVFVPAAKSKHIDLLIDYDPMIPRQIKGDPFRLRQVVFNLLSNAIKFTEKGEVRVLLHFEPIHDSCRGRLVVKVKDSGIGMTPDTLARMFKPFEQADATLARKHGGTGLGLAISRYITEAMGGSLTVDSKFGHGATFQAEFDVELLPENDPRSTELERTREGRSSKFYSPTLNDTNGTNELTPSKPRSGAERSIRILLAEDGLDNQKLIKWMLERKFGADVTVVDDGVKAVEQAIASETDRPFDLILMDVQMPILDGLSAARQLREKNYSRPIIALTAHASSIDIDSSMEAGCNFHISKPIDWERLRMAIQSVCEVNL